MQHDYGNEQRELGLLALMATEATAALSPPEMGYENVSVGT